VGKGVWQAEKQGSQFIVRKRKEVVGIGIAMKTSFYVSLKDQSYLNRP
jgi:hypothetical protein